MRDRDCEAYPYDQPVGINIPLPADAATIPAPARGAFHLPFAASPTSVPKFQKVFGIDNLVEIPFCLDLL